MITIRDLIKIYQDLEQNIKVPALRGCDLEISQGEIISIIGPSGSGKTTLVNILAGLETITSGYVEVAGYDLEKLTKEELNYYRLNIISNVDQFPERNLFLELSVYENLKFAQMLKYGFTTSFTGHINSILQKLGIQHLKHRICKTLSGGEMTRLALGCAFAKNTPLILCDEPTGQLDSTNTENVKNLMREMVKKFNSTILIVTHDQRFLEGMDRTCEIKNGRISAILSEEERKRQRSYPFYLKSHIDSTRSARIPDIIYNSLSLDKVLEFEISENNDVKIHNPSKSPPKKIPFPEISSVIRNVVIKDLPKDYMLNDEKMIVFQGVSKKYVVNKGEVNALENINLEIYDGELVFILGPSGSGKTTLLKIITGLEPTTEGAIRILGEDFHRFSDEEKAKFRFNNFGIIAQQGNLHPFLTLLENITIKDIIGNVKNNSNGNEKRAFELLKNFKLEHKAKSYPLEISGGELQRACLASAVYGNPKILVLDEPTANLDSDLAKIAIEQVLELHKNLKITLLIATHDLSLLQKGYRAIELSDGKITRNGLVEK